MCTLCQCLLTSEVYLLSHLRGAPHMERLKGVLGPGHSTDEQTAECNLQYIADATDSIQDPQVVFFWFQDKIPPNKFKLFFFKSCDQNPPEKKN